MATALIYGVPVFGADGFPLRLEDSGPTPNFPSFLGPNEGQLNRLEKWLSKAPPGLLLSLGADRALFAAVLYPGITHLLVVDMDPNVALFHRLNFILIKIADQIADYRDLRLRADHRQWLEWSNKNHVYLTAEEQALIADPANWTWWQGHVVHSGDAKLELLHQESAAGSDLFQGGNYIFDPPGFGKIQDLARSGHTQVLRLDLKDTEHVELVAKAMEESEIPLGALEISNAWNNFYIPPDRLAALIEAFNRVASDQTLFIYSGRHFHKNKKELAVAHQLRGYDPVDEYTASELLKDWFYQAQVYSDFRSDLGFLGKFILAINANMFNPLELSYGVHINTNPHFKRNYSSESLETQVRGLGYLHSWSRPRFRQIVQAAGRRSLGDQSGFVRAVLAKYLLEHPEMADLCLSDENLSADDLALVISYVFPSQKDLCRWIEHSSNPNLALKKAAASGSLWISSLLSPEQLRELMSDQTLSKKLRVNAAVELAASGERNDTIEALFHWVLSSDDTFYDLGKIFDYYAQSERPPVQAVKRAQVEAASGFTNERMAAIRLLLRARDSKSIAVLRQIYLMEKGNKPKIANAIEQELGRPLRWFISDCARALTGSRPVGNYRLDPRTRYRRHD